MMANVFLKMKKKLKGLSIAIVLAMVFTTVLPSIGSIGKVFAATSYTITYMSASTIGGTDMTNITSIADISFRSGYTAPTSGSSDGAVVLPTEYDIKRTNASFKGWYKTFNPSENVYSDQITSIASGWTSNITLYGKWENQSNTELVEETDLLRGDIGNTTGYFIWHDTGNPYDTMTSGYKIDICGALRKDPVYPTYSAEYPNIPKQYKGNHNYDTYAFSYNYGFNINAIVSTTEIPRNSSGGSLISFDNRSNTSSFKGNFNGAVTHFGSSNEIEAKIKMSISPDKKYALLDLYLYNTTNNLQYVSMRLQDDTMLDNNDGSRNVFNKDEGLIHCVNDNKSYSYYNSIDVINSDDGTLGLDAFNVAWSGPYGSRNTAGNAWADYVSQTTSDYGISMGWLNIPVRKNETVHRRVAFLARTTSFYVNSTKTYEEPTVSSKISSTVCSGTDSYGGCFEYPFKTVQSAYDAFEDVNGGSGVDKGFICIQDSGVRLPENFVLDSGKDITICTADIDDTGHKINDKKTLFVPHGTKITVKNGTKLTIQDLIIDGDDGNRDFPFIIEEDGEVTLGSGVEIKNFKNINGSAIISVADGAKLNIYGLNAYDNKSKTGYHAIDFNTQNDIEGFKINGVNYIYSNTNTDNKKANVYIATASQLLVTELLKNDNLGTMSRISLSLPNEPDASLGEITKVSQELAFAYPQAPNIAAKIAGYPNYKDLSTCPFAQYFELDSDSASLSAPTAGKFNDGIIDNSLKAVITKSGYKVTFKFRNDGGGSIAGASKEYKLFGEGENVKIASPSKIDIPILANYTFLSGSANDSALTVDSMGNVTGTMPNHDVEITYIYKLRDIEIKFTSNGGTPKNVPVISGKQGSPVVGILASPRKYGYTFEGWFDNNDDYDHIVGPGTAGKITSLPSTFPAEDMMLYAKYKVDQNVKSGLSESHTNIDGTIVFEETAAGTAAQMYAEQPIISSGADFASITIPGYKASVASSSVTPKTYMYGSIDEPVGTFTQTSATQPVRFNGKMPGATTLITYKYAVDPSQTKTFKAKFLRRTDSGDEVPFSIGGVTEYTANYPAEAAIIYDPPTKVGYSIINAEIDTSAVLPAHTTRLKGSFEPANNFKFLGNMSNYDGTIKYIYESTGDKFEFITDYIDTTSNDPSNKYIVDSDIENNDGDIELRATKSDIYGYNYSNGVAYKASDPTDPYGTIVNGVWTGIQPREGVTLTFNYTRNPLYFKTVTYKPAVATMSDFTTTLDITGKSADMTSAGSGSFKSDVLITTADGLGWSFEKIKNKNLTPNVTLDDTTFYQMRGFFYDKNDDGIFNGNDELLTNDFEFTDPSLEGISSIVVRPYIERNPSQWVIINFAGDEHGTVDTTGFVDVQYKNTSTWADVSKPTVFIPAFAYIESGDWYFNNMKVENTDYLVSGTYIMKFIKNPAIFGGLKEVQATVGIGSDGKGQLIVRDTNENYKYALTKHGDNNVLQVKEVISGANVSFATLPINASYDLYEVDAIVNPGDNIGSISDKSTAKEYFVPPILENYEITMDASMITHDTQNIASLTIKPVAADTEYALYQGGSPVSGQDFRMGATSTGVQFTGLTPGATYRVVTRLSGTPTTDTGTVIYIDAASLLDQQYAVTVYNGTTGGETTKLYSKGATVSINASTAVGFIGWECLSGSLSFANANAANTTFTMPGRNVVVSAKATNAPAHFALSQTQYGLSSHKSYFDTSDKDAMINILKEGSEDSLASQGFNIEYKVRYNLDELTFEEEEAIKNAYSGDDAARGAIAINVDIDRYIEGQRVDNAPIVPSTLTSPYTTINNMFGSAVIDAIPGFEDFLKGMASQEPTSETETTTISEEPEEDEILVETETETETESAVETETEIETESAVETETETETESAVETEAEVENEEESETEIEIEVETETESSEVNEEENVEEHAEEVVEEVAEEIVEEVVEEAEEEVIEELSSFTGTEDINYEEIYEDLMLFGSNFTADPDLITTVVLPTSQLDMKLYRVYEWNGSSLINEVSLDDNVAKKGNIVFTAKKGKRYIITYELWHNVKLVVNNGDVRDHLGFGEKTFSIKHGGVPTATDIPELTNFSVGRADYTDGMYLYKNNNDRTSSNEYQRGTDAVLAPLTLYVSYASNAGEIGDLNSAINNVLNAAREIMTDYFITNEEKNRVSAKYNELLTKKDDLAVSSSELSTLVNELWAIINLVQIEIDKREADYNKQPDKKTTGGGSVGGGGGGGGGSGGGGGGAKGSANDQSGINPLTAQSLPNTDLNNANSVISPRTNDTVVFSSSSKWINNNDGSWSLNVDINNSSAIANNGFYNVASIDELGNIHSNIYYFNSQGKMSIGFINDILGNTYFFNTEKGINEGIMTIGWKQFGNDWRFFGGDGKMYKNMITPDGYMIGADGLWVR